MCEIISLQNEHEPRRRRPETRDGLLASVPAGKPVSKSKTKTDEVYFQSIVRTFALFLEMSLLAMSQKIHTTITVSVSRLQRAAGSDQS